MNSGSLVVKTLDYQSEGCAFEFQYCQAATSGPSCKAFKPQLLNYNKKKFKKER